MTAGRREKHAQERLIHRRLAVLSRLDRLGKRLDILLHHRRINHPLLRSPKPSDSSRTPAPIRLVPPFSKQGDGEGGFGLEAQFGENGRVEAGPRLSEVRGAEEFD